MIRPAVEAALTGLACLAFATVTDAVGVTLAELPDLSSVKTPAFDPWNMGAAGFVVWYAWYVTAKVIPKLVAQHGDQMKEQAVRNAEQLTSIIADFRAELNQIRADYREMRDAVACKKSGGSAGN